MEKYLVEEYLNILSKDFYIQKEVEGFSIISGKTKRIDAIIKSKEHPNIVFGIEFKRADLESINKFTKWFKQAIVYTQTIWNGYGKVPIIIAPSIAFPNKLILSRLIGEFGVGELGKHFCSYNLKNIYEIRKKDTKIWSSESGWNKIALKMDFKKYLDL